MSEQGQGRGSEAGPARASSAAILPHDFLETLYLAVNPDVADAVAAGAWPSGAAHFLVQGRHEQRPSLSHHLSPASGLPPGTPSDPDMAGFDATGYLALYPDLALALGDDPGAARVHWLASGRMEGRLGPGIAPYAQRRPSLDGLLARPFGVELYAPFADDGARGAQARALLAGLHQAGIPIEARAFDVAYATPRIAIREQASPGRRRISLLLAEPLELAGLAALYPPDHFAASYVIAAWSAPAAAFGPGWHAVFGAIDELWVVDEPARQDFASFAPVPVHAVPLPLPVEMPPALPVPPPTEPGSGAVVLLLSGRGAGAIRIAADMLTALARALGAGPALMPDTRVQLVLTRIDVDHEAVLRGLLAASTSPAVTAATLLAAPLSPQAAARLAQQGRLLIAPEDGLDSQLAAQAFAAARKPVLAPQGSVLARRLARAAQALPVRVELSVLPDGVVRMIRRQALPEIDGVAAAVRALLDGVDDGAADQGALEGGDGIGSIRPILQQLDRLGLDLSPPPFFASFGRSFARGTPAIPGRLSGSWLRMTGRVGRWPTLGILLRAGRAEPAMLRRCIDTVLDQPYPFWTLSLIEDGTGPEPTRRLVEALRGSHPQLRVDGMPGGLDPALQLNRAAERCVGTHLLLLEADALLQPDALQQIAEAIEAGAPAMLYGDEVTSPGAGEAGIVTRRPDWSPEQLRAENHLGSLLVVERLAWQRLGGLAEGFGDASGYELALRLIEAGASGAHLAEPVLRRAGPSRSDPAAERRALQAHAARTGARLEPRPDGTVRFRPQSPVGQPISVVVTVGSDRSAGGGSGPDTGRSAAVGLVRALRRWLRAAAGEIMVVAASRPGDAELAALQAQGARIETVARSGAGRAGLRNAGLSRATHPLVLFLDPGVVPEPDLLAALLEAMQDPTVVAAGPWLAPPAAGAVRTSPDLVRPDRMRNVSALSGACLMLRRAAARLVRGYDETLLPDLAADIDLCLRLRQSGQRLVCTPHGIIGSAPAGGVDGADARAALSLLWSDASLDGFELSRMPARRARPQDAPAMASEEALADKTEAVPPPELSLPPEERALAALLLGLVNGAAATATANPILTPAPAEPAEPPRPPPQQPAGPPASRRSSWRRSS